VKNPTEGEKIRKQGFGFCQKYHSTQKRVQFVIDIFNEKKTDMELSVERLLS